MSYTPGPLPEPDEHWMTDAHKYTAEQLSAHTAAEVARAVAAERERCAKVCDAERAEFMERAAHNDGSRESDFAFGSVNSAERIAAAIRADPQRFQGKGE